VLLDVDYLCAGFIQCHQAPSPRHRPSSMLSVLFFAVNKPDSHCLNSPFFLPAGISCAREAGVVVGQMKEMLPGTAPGVSTRQVPERRTHHLIVRQRELCYPALYKPAPSFKKCSLKPLSGEHIDFPIKPAFYSNAPSFNRALGDSMNHSHRRRFVFYQVEDDQFDNRDSNGENWTTKGKLI
jgi:hypothetical protein